MQSHQAEERTPEDRTALAAQVFPKEWARWATAPGKAASKRRQQLRKAAEIEVDVLRPLRAAGAKCQTCASFKSYPHGKPGDHYCADQSDFHGYTLTPSNGLCAHWHGKGGMGT